jgi:hypothetical protein
VAVGGVKLGGRDDLCQLLHVRRLDVDNVEALVLDVEMPQVDPKVVATDKGFPVAVDRNAVDVVRVGVGIRLSGNRGDDRVVVGQARQLQVGGDSEVDVGIADGASADDAAARRQLMRQIVLRHDFERLLVDLPQLDGLVVGREQVVGGILASAPLDLVDLLFDLQRLEVVELRLMRLKFGVKLVFAGLLLPTRDMSSAAAGGRGFGALTLSLRSKRTTRPPLSPVAR